MSPVECVSQGHSCATSRPNSRESQAGQQHIATSLASGPLTSCTNVWARRSCSPLEGIRKWMEVEITEEHTGYVLSCK